MGFLTPRQVPIELFPGDWCVNCDDPEHKETECYMLEMVEQIDGVDIRRCGCDNSVTAGRPGRYVLRVTRLQEE